MNIQQRATAHSVKAAVAVAATAAVLAACGAGSAGSPTSTPSSASSSSASSTASASVHFAGTYKVMTIDEVTQGPGVSQPPFPEMVQGVEAGVDSLNKSGGIVAPDGDHYSVKLITCDTQGTPNGANNCAQKGVADGIVAVVGGEDMYNSYLTTLAAHNIPNIAPLAVAGALADADSYPIYGGGTIELVGSMAALAGLHKNDVSIVVPSDDISAVASIVAPALKSITQLSSKTTGVAANAVDMSPYVQTAGRDDATAAFLGGSQLTSFIQAFQQQYGGKGKALISAAEEITPQVIKQLGKYADGLYVASAFLPPSDTAVPAVAAFDSAMQALGKSPLIDEVSQDGYSAVQLFAQAVKGISPSAVTGEAIKSKLNRMSNVDLGMSAPVSFQAPFTGPPNPKVARLFNPNIIYDRVEDGRLVIASKGSSPFVNAYTAAPFTAVP